MTRSRSGTRQLGRLLDSIPNPVYALDGRRTIVYANSACTDWLGAEADAIVGLRCDYCSSESSARPRALAIALCPPPEVFAGQQRTAWIHCRNAGGEVVWREGSFVPLGSGEGDADGTIAVLSSKDRKEEPTRVSNADPSSEELHRRLQMLASEYRSRFRLERLVGESIAIRRIRRQIDLAISGRSRVVIIGPPGSGREQIARTIHGGGVPESSGPLMPLSCSLLDAELLQTTVVAFLRRCQDLPPQQSATLLLLNIDELSPDAQAEMLAFFRVPTFDLRTLVTTRRSLITMAAEEKFLRDLAYSLSDQVIEVPGLADRRQDIPFLVQQMLEEQNERGERQISGFSSEALDTLASMLWKGNVEELASVVSEAIRNAAGPFVTAADLPQEVNLQIAAAAHPPRAADTIQLDEFLGDIERELIQRALREARGNKAKAARLLGIHRARLLRRIPQLGLDPHEPESET